MMNNLNTQGNLQGTCKLSQPCNPMQVLARSRKALSLPATQRQPSPLRNKPTSNAHKISSIVCPITSSKLHTDNGRSNASWNIYISTFQDKLNQTHKIDLRRPVSQYQSRSSFCEVQKDITNKQQQQLPNQQDSMIIYPPQVESNSHSQHNQEFPATHREQLQSASSSILKLNSKKPNQKINSVVLAMMNKKNNILKSFMQQQQNQLISTQTNNSKNFVALTQFIKSNFVQDKDHSYSQNSSRIHPISNESNYKQQQKQSQQESSFRLKSTNSQSQLKETIQKQEKQYEKQTSSTGRLIYEFPKRKHRTVMSSERLSWSNSNSTSSTNLFPKSKQNQSEIMSPTILSRNNSISQNMNSQQMLKIQEITASMKEQQDEPFYDKYKQPQRDAYNLLIERPYNFLQKTDQYLKQEEEIMQKAAISPQLKKINFNRRAQSAQYQSRNRLHSATSNTGNGQSSRFININNNNSYSSYSLKALRDERESEKSEQSSLKSWKRQTIIEGGISVENSLENAVQSDQIEVKVPNPTPSDSISKIKMIASKASTEIRNYSSRIEPSLQKTKRISVLSHPNGVKKSLCGCSFTTAI